MKEKKQLSKSFVWDFAMKEHVRKICAYQLRLKTQKQFLLCLTRIMPFHLHLSYTDKTVLLFSVITWKKVVRFDSHLHLNRPVAFSWLSAHQQISAELPQNSKAVTAKLWQCSSSSLHNPQNNHLDQIGQRSPSAQSPLKSKGFRASTRLNH